MAATLGKLAERVWMIRRQSTEAELVPYSVDSPAVGVVLHGQVEQVDDLEAVSE